MWRRGEDASSERREGERTQGTFIVFGPSSVQSWFAGNKAPVHTNSVDREGQGGAIRLARRILRRGGNGRALSARARVVRVSGGSRRRSKLCGADGQPARDPQFSRRPLGREARKSQVGDKGPQHSTPRRPRGRGKSWFARLRCPGFTWQTSGTLARGRHRSPLGALAQAP